MSKIKNKISHIISDTHPLLLMPFWLIYYAHSVEEELVFFQFYISISLHALHYCALGSIIHLSLTKLNWPPVNCQNTQHKVCII